jgi:hypothetical protein
MRSRAFRARLLLTLPILLAAAGLSGCGAGTPLYSVCSPGNLPFTDHPVPNPHWNEAALPTGTAPLASAHPVGFDTMKGPGGDGDLPDRIVSTSSGTAYRYQYTGTDGAGYYLADCG